MTSAKTWTSSNIRCAKSDNRSVFGTNRSSKTKEHTKTDSNRSPVFFVARMEEGVGERLLLHRLPSLGPISLHPLGYRLSLSGSPLLSCRFPGTRDRILRTGPPPPTPRPTQNSNSFIQTITFLNQQLQYISHIAGLYHDPAAPSPSLATNFRSLASSSSSTQWVRRGPCLKSCTA